MTCAALLAALFPGVVLADVDRTRVYEIPAEVAATVPMAHKLLARSCARRYGIRWRIIGELNSPATIALAGDEHGI